MAIPASYIQELVARNDIYDTISRYVSLLSIPNAARPLWFIRKPRVITALVVAQGAM